jgi:pyrroloquinoline quinone biosynthesis protein B
MVLTRSVIARIIGSAQDGGVPQVGCGCERCDHARRNMHEARFPASLAIVTRTGRLLLFDVTPSLPQQLDLLKSFFPNDRRVLPDAVLLTHAHVGHYGGLIFFGKEVASTKEMPVYCSSKMGQFLGTNKPFSHLVERGEIRILDLHTGETVVVDESLRVTPIEVPHRNEDADTMAFVVESSKTLFYAPDFDHYSEEIDRCVRNSNISILDGCFWSREELTHREFEAIPHPTIIETRERFRGYENRIVLTHINHTNPVLNQDGVLRSELEKIGFRVAREGMDIQI